MRIKISKKGCNFLFQRFKKFSLVLTIFLSVILISYFFFERIYPNYIAHAEIFAKNTSQKIIAKSLKTVLEQNDYESFVKVENDSEGMITSIEADTLKMNRFRTELIFDIQKRTEELGKTFISIPLGSLLKNEIFSGIGPSFKITIMPQGFVSADFKDEFISCGINHIKHKVNLEITLYFTLISSTMKKTTKVVQSVPVTETIISGEVPYYYGNGILPAT